MKMVRVNSNNMYYDFSYKDNVLHIIVFINDIAVYDRTYTVRDNEHAIKLILEDKLINELGLLKSVIREILYV